MFAILASVFNGALGWVFRVVIVRFVVLVALAAVVAEMAQVLIGLLPSWMSFAGLFGGFTPLLWYFVDMFRLDYGLPIIVSAYVTRFLIRRIPVIG
jgi:hypothetical protein